MTDLNLGNKVAMFLASAAVGFLAGATVDVGCGVLMH